MDPLVSIIIPVYNGANYLSEAIDSALAQTYSNIEIIVVNDGSNDGGATEKIAQSYGNKIRYFEKPNGGVSTALNLGIEKMRGKYFSWLSHDDLYYPNKIQAQIDALREAGDMSKIVYSNYAGMRMPNRTVTEVKEFLNYRQNFLETGAFLPVFSLVSGCSLLIPKFYFDAYGGFDEKYRAIQDYKKWFEMFRGKRLIYLRDTLIISRNHSQQTGKTYGKVREEEEYLYNYIIQNFEDDDLVGGGLTDMYHFYSAFFTMHFFTENISSVRYAFQQLNKLPESPDIDERIDALINFLNQDEYDTYFLKDHEPLIKKALAWRGLSLEDDSIFVSAEQFQNIKSDKIVRGFSFISLLQILIDTPIRKAIIQNIN